MNKKMKVLIVCICISFVITSCRYGEDIIEESYENSNEGFEITDLDIKDFSWEIEQKEIDGVNCYVFSLTNNSKFTLLWAGINYKLKGDISSQQREGFYDSFQKIINEEYANLGSIYQFTKEEVIKDYGEIVLSSTPWKECIGSHESFDDGIVYYDNMDSLPTKDDFELVEPCKLELYVLGDDFKVYKVAYDFYLQTWSVYEISEELYNWPKMDVAKKIPIPEEHLYGSDYEISYLSTVDVYDMDENEFNDYLEKVKGSGFNINEDTWTEASNIITWVAEDMDGNFVGFRYNVNRKMLYISIYDSSDSWDLKKWHNHKKMFRT